MDPTVIGGTAQSGGSTRLGAHADYPANGPGTNSLLRAGGHRDAAERQSAAARAGDTLGYLATDYASRSAAHSKLCAALDASATLDASTAFDTRATPDASAARDTSAARDVSTAGDPFAARDPDAGPGPFGGIPPADAIAADAIRSAAPVWRTGSFRSQSGKPALALVARHLFAPVLAGAGEGGRQQLSTSVHCLFEAFSRDP